jgi:uncharacterized iron-regulated membrane protein
VGFAEPGEQTPVVEAVVDPAAMLVTEVREPSGAFDRWVHRLHETLLLGPGGRSAIGWISVGLLFLGVSGIPLWWPAPGRWRAALA